MMGMRTRWVFRRVLTDQITVRNSASFVVRGDVSTVWATLGDPQTSVETEPAVFAAGYLGPTRGLGEIQYFLYRKNEQSKTRLYAHEVIEYEHERRSLTEGLTYIGYHSRVETVVEPAGEGTVRISLQWWRGFGVGTSTRTVMSSYRARAENAAKSVREYASVFTIVADE